MDFTDCSSADTTGKQSARNKHVAKILREPQCYSRHTAAPGVARKIVVPELGGSRLTQAGGHIPTLVQDAEDEELIDDCRRSPDPAVRRDVVGQLFQRHQAKVILWCYRFTGNREMAADLTQEIFAKAYIKLDSFQGNSRFSTWLYTVTLNHCRDHASKQAIRRERLSESLTGEEPHSDDFDVRLEKQEELQMMRELMRKTLSDTEQKVLLLHYGEEMKLSEVTRLLGFDNPSGAKAHVVNARRKLSLALDRWKQRVADRRRSQ